MDTATPNKKKQGIKMNSIIVALISIALFFTIPCTAYGNEIQPTDYSKPEHWVSVPFSVEKQIDVFYLYPTVWHKVNANAPDVCKIDNPVMLKGAKVILELQATAFETVGNIYAPYYRQYDASTFLPLPPAEQDKLSGGITKADVLAAFDYYIKHFNRGRPFILAGHSQGSAELAYILSEYMKEHPEVHERMIAAYAIGYSITAEYLAKNPHLKFAVGPSDTGVIIAYNTEAPKIEGPNLMVTPGAISINPITWTREETLATAGESLGSLMMGDNGKTNFKKNYADARVNKERGVVVCSTVDSEKLYVKNIGIGKGIYHLYDFSFYYYNLRENAANRANHYLNK